MTDTTTPNSLIKIETPITARHGKKQIAVYIVAGTIIVLLIDIISKDPHNTPLVCSCIISMLVIAGLVYKFARSKTAIYEAELKIMFALKNAVKKNEIHKFDPKNTLLKTSSWTGLENVDDQGRLTFKKTKVYEGVYCNRGTCWLAFPSDANDPDAYYDGMEKLYRTIPTQCIHKTITAQSKHLSNIEQVYAEKLKNKNLPIVVRAGYRAKKKYFENIKNRVGWMHVIFVGIEYTPNDTEANDLIDEIREKYGESLELHGVSVRVVTDPTEYAIICAQLGHMDNLEGVL
jgi:hypothetical protein